MTRLVLKGLACIAAGLLVSFSVFAQENVNRDGAGKIVRGSYETNRLFDNIFIEAGAGVNSWVGNNTNGKIGVATDLSIGKWITPSVGARLSWKGLKNGAEGTDGFTADDNFIFNTLHFDFLWNLSNAISGYKETRTWNVSVYPTFAFMRGATNDELGVGVGLLNNFRISNRVGIFLDLSTTFTKNDFPKVNPDPNAILGFVPTAAAGISVNLGKTGFKRVAPAVVPLPFTEDDYNALKTRVASLEKENKDLRAQIDELKNTVPDTVTVFKAGNLVSPATLYFEIGQTDLSERELAHLDFYLKNILEQAPDKTFILTGYADKGTGSASRNQYLSSKRVEKVKEILVEKYGVDADRLVVKAEGDKVNRFASPVLNRVVTIETE